MSPRRAAIVVAVVALPVVVASLVSLPSGGVVSLVSALGLAAGLTGVGVALVWATRSSWEPEPAASPRAPDRAAAHRRARRLLRVQGWVGVAGGLGILVLSYGMDDGERATVRLGALGVGLLILGAVSIVIARATGRGRKEEDAAPDDGPLPSGWILVSRRDRGSLLIFAVPALVAGVWGVWQFVPLVLLTVREAPTGILVALGIGVVAAVAGGVAWARRQVPDVWVDVEAGRARVGSRVVAGSELTSARLSATAMIIGGTRSLFLILEGPEKLRVPLLLRRHGALAMTPVQRRAALALVDAAAIELPRAKEDPTGKFSRTLFPTHLDAAQARDLVAHPPRSDEDLPVAVG